MLRLGTKPQAARRSDLRGPYGVGQASYGVPQLLLRVGAGGAGFDDEREQPVTERVARLRVTPTREARPTTLAARCSAGSAVGTPSSTELRPFSDALRASQFSSTSAASATSRPANTCGCRCTSLSTMPPATSSMVKPPSSGGDSAAMRAWKYTCSSRSPSSSRRCTESPVSIASSVS